MKEPLFSIVIPVYNVESYLEECLWSVLNQSISDYEVILVDDGSSDKSPEICDRFATEHESFFVFHKKNSGVLSTRDFGIHKAKGQYIVFLDSDDKLKENALKIIRDKLASFDYPDCLIFSFERLYKDGTVEVPDSERGTVRSDTFITDKKAIFRTVLEHSNYNSVVRKVIKKDILLKCNLKDYYHISHGEDLIQTVSVYRYAGSFLLIPDILYQYRENPTGLTASTHKTKLPYVSYEKEELVISYFREFGGTEDEIDEYRTYLRKWLYIYLVETSTARISFRKKMKWFKAYRENGFYDKFLSSECSPFPFRGQKLHALVLLENRHFKRLLWYCLYLKAKSIATRKPIDGDFYSSTDNSVREPDKSE